MKARSATSQALLAALDEALRQLATTRGTDRAIHDARKELKKARAALRLLRPMLGEKRYRAENLALRDAGRLLAPLRDAKALLEALERFARREGKRIDVRRLGRVRAQLRKELAAARRRFHPRSREVSEARRIVKLHRERIAVATDQETLASDVGEGLRKLYRQARKAARRLPKDASAGELHEWRKRVKVLRNAAAALEEPTFGRGNRAVAQAGKIGDLLGEDHDLVLLCEALPANQEMQDLIAARRAKLQRRARRLGKKLFEPKPKRFVQRMGFSTGSSRRGPLPA